MSFLPRTAFALLLSTAPLGLAAQNPIAPLLRRHVEFLDIRGLNTPGAPFSGTCVLDFVPAAGSSEPLVHEEEKFYRDSQGRMRTDYTWKGSPERHHVVDPGKGRWLWTAEDTEPKHFDAPAVPVNPPQPAPAEADAPRVAGVATILTHPGSNSSPGSVLDMWYSPELRMPLSAVVEAPDWGKLTLRFTSIVRGDPDASLFAVPTKLAGKPSDVPSGAVAGQGGDVSAAAQPAYASDPKFQKALADAKERKPMTADDRLSLWKKALKVSKGQCIECLHEVIRFQLIGGAYKDVQNTGEQLLAVSSSPGDKLFAESSIGQALMHSNFDEPKRAQQEEAEKHLRAALEVSPRQKVVLYAEGRVLAMLGREDEAKKMFERYVEVTPESDRYHLRAEHFIDNPHLAAEHMAPPFKFVTAQGEEIELDDMHGKVVLLDFWATWCGPCKESLPDIQRIARDFKDEPLVVISISQDADASAWKKFVQDHNMDWPQYRDHNGALSRAYGVNAIPHYFTIDSNGVLQTEMVGSNSDVRGKLKKLVKQAREAREHVQVAASR